MIQRFVSLIQTLTGSSSSQSGQQASKPFMILGIVFLVIAVLTLVIAKTELWLLIAVAAIVQLAMGMLLKRNSG